MKSRGNSKQYACFACRKCFKRPQAAGSNDRFMPSEQAHGQRAEASLINSRRYKCPDCGGQTHFMGIDFKAPKASDTAAWATAQAFILAGNLYNRHVRAPAAEA